MVARKTTEGKRFDRILDALGHAYRRRLLVALLAHNPQDDDDPQHAREALQSALGEEVPADVDDATLVHSHLPKLEEYGYIAWDRQEETIAKGPNWEEIRPVLELLRAHSDELPDDWL
jgi:hypothetical protein